MSEKFSLEILSPESLIIKTDVKQVVIPSFEGEMGILNDHIPLITFLRPGLVKIFNEDEKTFFVEEGTVEFANNNLLILTSSAVELPSKNKQSLVSLLSEAEKQIISEEITDKEKYLLSYKIETLKSITR
jgi:F-type H+-transporting ATPase subunit epsilon/F-type H+-transporting ATPase subunit delta